MLIHLGHRHLNLERYQSILGRQKSVHGLGQLAKDLKIGPLRTQEFLSKIFYGKQGSFTRNPLKCLVTGAVMRIDCPLYYKDYLQVVQYSLTAENGILLPHNTVVEINPR